MFNFESLFKLDLDKASDIGENRRVKNKITLMMKSLSVVAAAACLTLYFGFAQASVPTKGKNAQKIAKLKQELSRAKGQKRVKLIKQIAEMENSDLELKLQSFR